MPGIVTRSRFTALPRVEAMVNAFHGEMIAVMVFALILGIALTLVERRAVEPLLLWLQALYEVMKQQVLHSQVLWTDDTPVPPSVFGPMWEGTPPPWWTDDVLGGLPPEPATAAEKPSEEQPAPADDAVAPH